MKEDRHAAKLFFNNKGIDARPFPKNMETKSADFQLYKTDKLCGYSEVKSIVADNFIGERHDPSYNKIQNKIHEAAKQFIDCNLDHNSPNILVLINHNPHLGFQDLWLVLTGSYLPPSQEPDFIEPRYLKRLLNKDDLSIIDYFVWIDYKIQKICFTINPESKFIDFLKSQISSKAYENLHGL